MPDSLSHTGALAAINDAAAAVAKAETMIRESPGASETPMILLGATLREIGCTLRSIMLTAVAVRRIYKEAHAEGREQGRMEGYAEGYQAALEAGNVIPAGDPHHRRLRSVRRNAG